MADEVRAAGGVVWRPAVGGGDGVEVLIVRRDRHRDWSFPKGKLDPGERWEDAALREVHEETGIVATLGRELAATRYEDSRGRPKRARYWAMAVVEDTGFEANDEVSARAWLDISDVASRLTYARDVTVLESFVRQHTSTERGGAGPVR